MKAWKRWMAALVALAMLVPMAAFAEAADQEAIDAVASTFVEEAVMETETELLGGDAAAVPDETPVETSVETPVETSAEPPAEPTVDEPEQTATESLERAEAPNDDAPRAAVDRTITLSDSTNESIQVGDTLRIHVNIPKASVVSWSSGSRKIATVKYDRKTGECVVTPKAEGNAKLKARLKNAEANYLYVNLRVTDPWMPSDFSFTQSAIRVQEGQEVDLTDLLVVDPPYIDKSTLTWKTSSKSAAQLYVENGGARIIAGKGGKKAKITVTSKKNKGLKARVLEVVVLANKVVGMCEKPTDPSDYEQLNAEEGWTLWPYSVELAKNGNIVCQLYLLNGTGVKVSRLENLTLSLAAGSPDNVVASGGIDSMNVSIAHGRYKLIKLTLQPNDNFSGVFLPTYDEDDALFFDLMNMDEVRLVDRGGSEYSFVPTMFPDYDFVPVEDIELSEDEATLAPGQTLTLTATVSPEDATNKRLAWSSNNPSVAKVENGVVKALAPGEAIIVAEATDGSGEMAFCSITVRDDSFVPVEDIELRPTELILSPGEVTQLAATVSPDNATNKKLSWYSDDSSVAKVVDGEVTAVAPGSTYIMAAATDGSDETAFCWVKVTKSSVALVTDIQLSRETLRMYAGTTQTLTATVLPANAANPALSWSSDNNSVATVTGGVVTAHIPGTATITAAATDGSGVKAFCRITVEGASQTLVTGILLSQSNLTMNIGTTQELTATVIPADAANPALSWSSDNNSVATVTGGVVTAVAAGTATITAAATDGSGVKAACEVTVVGGSGDVTVTGIWLDLSSATIKPEETLTLKATVIPANATNQSVIWSSSDETVATVSDGVVTGVNGGDAVIKATAADGSGQSASCQISVRSVYLGSSELTVEVGDEKAVQVIFYSKSGSLSCTNSAYTDVRWGAWSGNSATGYKTTLYISGKAEGEAKLTVKSKSNANDCATLNVKVIPRTSGTGSVKYRALLIGEEAFSPKCTRNRGDVTLMKDMLNSVTGPNGGKYTITQKFDLGKTAVKSAISEAFAGADDDDVSLFFIATHGDTTSTGASAGALALISSSSSSERYILMSELATALKAVPGKVIVLVESCGSGAGVYTTAAEQNGTKSAPKALNEDGAAAAEAFDAALVKAFSDADPGITVTTKGVSANTGELRVENKFYVLTASRYQEESYGTEGGPYNYFTKWLTDGVGTSGTMPADTDSNGTTTLNELFSYISNVGDKKAFSVFGKSGYYYQHVQVYPKKCGYGLFCR